jgi:hypothetical protein
LSRISIHAVNQADLNTSHETGKGTFTGTLTGLSASTMYNLRVHDTNSAGTVYSKEVSFTTMATPVILPPVG